MAADRHSRLVGRAKVVLPLAALALLSSLVLLSEEPSPEVAVTGTGERRIGRPDFAAVTEDGARISVTARMARPKAGGVAAEGLAARIDGAAGDGGRWATLAGRAGVIDEAQTVLALEDGTLAISEGYEVDAADMDLFLTETRVTGRGDVVARAPATRVTAQAMEMDADVLTFTGQVRLVYRPSGP